MRSLTLRPRLTAGLPFFSCLSLLLNCAPCATLRVGIGRMYECSQACPSTVDSGCSPEHLRVLRWLGRTFCAGEDVAAVAHDLEHPPIWEPYAENHTAVYRGGAGTPPRPPWRLRPKIDRTSPIALDQPDSSTTAVLSVGRGPLQSTCGCARSSNLQPHHAGSKNTADSGLARFAAWILGRGSPALITTMNPGDTYDDRSAAVFAPIRGAGA
jgi:hypothetical protein